MNAKEDHANAERRITAEIHVEAFMELISKRYGIEPEDIPRIMDDIRWVREHRSNISRVTWSVALGIITLAVGGLMAAMWEGIKQGLKH